jgi:hypothetical protein
VAISIPVNKPTAATVTTLSTAEPAFTSTRKILNSLSFYMTEALEQ